MSNLNYPYGLDRLKIPYEDKDDQYRKTLLDQYCLVSNDFNLDYQRMSENYLLKNSRLPKEQYRYLCGTFGDNQKTDMFIDMFNFTGNVIDSLKGEELGRPFPFSVVANSERINNRTERLKRDMISNLLEKILNLEIEKVERIKQIEMSKVPQEKAEQMQAELEEEFKKRFGNLPNIKQIFQKYDSIQSLEEITMNKVMKMLYHKNNIKKIKNDCFEDLLITSAEFVEIYCTHENSLPNIRRLNTLFTFYQKSPDVEFIDQADFAGYKERISIDQAIQEFGEYLDDEDFQEIVTQGANWGILGMDQKFFSNGQNPDPWRSQRFGENGLGYGGSHVGYDEWVNVGFDEFGGEHYGFIPNRPVNDFKGMHTTIQRRNMNRYIDKYVVYWKDRRKVGKLTYIDEFGDLTETIVDESFVIPKDAKKVTTNRDNLANPIIEYTWLDGRNNKMSLRWITINEVWKGIRLGRKHVVVEPLIASYKSLLNPFEIKLPILGVVVNNANAVTLSKMDAMKPWQKLYFAMMAKLLKTISLDRGAWTAINTMYMDKDYDIMKTLAIAEDQGLLFFNPALSAKDGLSSLMNSSKMAEKLDMTNYQAIQQYIQLLAFLEENIIKAAGMSPQRVAQTTQNSTATDNYRETQSSMNITEPLFYAHDVLWERIMKSYMEMVLQVLTDNSGILRDFLSDEEKVVVDFKYVSLVDNYNLRVGNSGKQVRIQEQAIGLAQALIQNDKINLSSFISLMKSEDLTEFQQQLKDIENENRKREEAMQQQQMQMQQEAEAKQIKLMEDGQMNELDKEFLKGYMKYKTDQMKSVYQNQSFDVEKDYNKDGIPDYFQMEQLERKLDIEEKKLALKGVEIEQQVNQKNQDLSIKKALADNKLKADFLKSETEEKKIKNQEKIEKIKAAIMRNKSKK